MSERSDSYLPPNTEFISFNLNSIDKQVIDIIDESILILSFGNEL